MSLCCSVTMSDSATPWTAAYQAFLSYTISQSLLKLMSIESKIPSNHLIFCRTLLLLPSIFPSTRVFFQWVSSSHQVAKILELQLQHQSFQWIFRLISFRIDWFGLPVIQGTLKSLLQHHSSKASILWCSAFFIVQLSHPYMYIGKIVALTRWNFVGKVMSLLFNMLCRLVTAFLPRSKRLFISWLQSPSTEPKKIKSVTVSIVSPSICHEWWDQMPWSSFSECWVLSQLFHSLLSLSSRGSIVPLLFLP